MASGDLRFESFLDKGKLSTPQVQKLRVFLDSGIWDGDYKDIQNIVIQRQGSEVFVSVNGIKSAPANEIIYPVNVLGIEE